MELSEILGDALAYPLNNVKALIIYVILGVIAAIVLTFTGVGTIASFATDHWLVGGGIAVIGLIIALIIFLVIEGYCLDIVKFGINRENRGPEVDVVRQAINGLKLFVVNVVYMIIPFVVTYILGKLLGLVGSIIGLIVIIVFAFALFMAQCRLAKNENLSDALNIPEAIADISRVGILKILALIVLLVIVCIIAGVIFAAIASLGDAGSTISLILSGIFEIYFLFVAYRASGLLYSNA